MVKAVEYAQLCALELVIDQLAHIIVVAYECTGVNEHKLLIYHPVLGHGGVEIVKQPHAVILDKHALGLGLLQEAGQILLGQLADILDNADLHAVGSELFGCVLLFALLADDEQGFFLVAEALVLQSLLDELGLAALQKTGEEEDGGVSDSLSQS